MAFYAAYLPPEKTGVSETDALAEAVVLRDGFSFPAFLFTGLWLLMKRLWLPLIGFAVIYGLIALAQMRYGLHPAAAAAAQLVIGGWLGLEGASLLGRKLVSGGWRLVDVVEARNQEEAERRFFERALVPQAQRPVLSAVTAPYPVASSRPAMTQGVIGMFPEANFR